ncbi:Ig-like domain-containing protein, partial [Vibrio owensii]|uniref:Ig-like domain-containing protein n=1 Tax=Vibrio owensii TaxID=696485 RepID=UPI003DA03B91
PSDTSGITISAYGTANGKSFSDTATLIVSDISVQDFLVTPEIETTAVGFTENFQATAVFSDGTSKNVSSDDAVTWESSDPSIATVDSDGVVTALSPSDTSGITISAYGTANGKSFSDTATLIVSDINAPSAVPVIEGIPLRGERIVASYTFDSNGGSTEGTSIFYWRITKRSGNESIVPCPSGENSSCSLEITQNAVDATIQSCVIPVNKDSIQGELACTETKGIDLVISGVLEYNQVLNAQVVGLDEEITEFSWRVNIDEPTGPKGDLNTTLRVEVPVEQGGTSESRYKIGTISKAISLGGDTNSDGVITDNEWNSLFEEKSDWVHALYINEASLKSAAYFIGKDVRLCISTKQYGELCRDASSSQDVNGGVCLDSSRCVVGGVYYDKDDPSITKRGISPISTIDWLGYRYYRQLTAAEYQLGSKAGFPKEVDTFWSRFSKGNKVAYYGIGTESPDFIFSFALFSSYRDGYLKDSASPAETVDEIEDYSALYENDMWPIDENPNIQLCLLQKKYVPVYGFFLPSEDDAEGSDAIFGDQDGFGDQVLRNDYLAVDFDGNANNAPVSVEASLYTLYRDVFDYSNWEKFRSEINNELVGDGTSSIVESRARGMMSPTTGWTPRNYTYTASKTSSPVDSSFYHSPTFSFRDGTVIIDTSSSLALHPMVICSEEIAAGSR